MKSRIFNLPDIREASSHRDSEIRQRLDQKTKPPGSLGELESLAFRMARIQGNDQIQVDTPCHLVFAADHGICEAGISPFPQEVTGQMVANFLAGGAAINVFCRHNRVALRVVDAGMASEPPAGRDLVHAAGRRGTASFRSEAAMTREELHHCLAEGGRILEAEAIQAPVVSLGEMGIGNTTTAAALLSALLGLPPEDCVGAGTGADAAMQQRKAAVIREALALHQPDPDEPLEVLRCLGGLEIAMMTGAFLRAGALGRIILVDGFIATAAWMVAERLQPALRDYSFFAHQSGERGHAAILQALDVRPLLHLDMRLGEGTGAVAAVPLLRLAAAFYNEMASFDEAGVSEARP